MSNRKGRRSEDWMRASPLLTCLWPGLPRLWLRGDWLALATAVGFGVGFNLVLVLSFIWPEHLPSSITAIGWLVVVATWGVSAVRSYRSIDQFEESPEGEERGLFLQAQGEYLKGHWFEAESLLRQLLLRRRRDVDAQLMLATLYRHTRRIDDARGCLERIERVDGAEKWRFEIEHERRLLKRLAETNTAKAAGTTGQVDPRGIVAPSSADISRGSNDVRTIH